MTRYTHKILLSLAVIAFGFALGAMKVSADSIAPAAQVPMLGTVNSGNFANIYYNWGGYPDHDGTSHQYILETLGAQGEAYVTQADSRLRGYAWSENVGWIQFDAYAAGSDLKFGAAGSCVCPGTDCRKVTGKAWGENFGDIEFDPVPATAGYEVCFDVHAGVMNGKAWSPNVGDFILGNVKFDIVATDPSEVRIKETDTPTVIGDSEIYFGANDNKNITVEYKNDGGSPLKTFKIDVESSAVCDVNSPQYNNPAVNVPVISGEYTDIPITHNFSDVDDCDLMEGADGVREYGIRAEIADMSGNTTIKDLKAQVVAGTLDSSPFTVTAAADTYADGDSKYEITQAFLKDAYGNGIRSTNSLLKEVSVAFNFTNTDDLNQTSNNLLPDDGDAGCYEHDENVIDPLFGTKMCGDTVSPSSDADILTMTSTDAIAEGLDPGDYSGLKVGAYAPTDSNNEVKLNNSTLTITANPPSGATNIGDLGGTGTSPIPNWFKDFTFASVFTNAFATGFPVEIGDGPVGAQYSMEISNDDSDDTIENIDVSQYCSITDAGGNDDSSRDCILKDEGGLVPPPPAGKESYSLVGASHYPDLMPTDASAIIAGVYNSLVGSNTRAQSIRSVVIGPLPVSDPKLNLRTDLGYKINGKEVFIEGEYIEGVKVITHDIGITGRVRSDVIGNIAFYNVGTISKEDVIDAVYRDVAAITRGTENETQYNSVAGTTETIDTSSWISTHGHAIPAYNGSILYYRGNVSISDLVVTGKKTLIVEGGDVFVNGDITYFDDNSSLGVIILKGNQTENKNVYIALDVTDISGIWYIEGSFFSYVSGIGNSCQSTDIIDGCNAGDPAVDMGDQLYFLGTYISYNTLDGSRKDPPELPVGVSVSGYDSKGNADKLNIAQGYDLKYLRAYYPAKAGPPPVAATGAESDRTDKTQSVVIDYDQNLFSKARVPFGFEGAIQASQEQRIE